MALTALILAVTLVAPLSHINLPYTPPLTIIMALTTLILAVTLVAFSPMTLAFIGNWPQLHPQAVCQTEAYHPPDHKPEPQRNPEP